MHEQTALRRQAKLQVYVYPCGCWGLGAVPELTSVGRREGEYPDVAVIQICDNRDKDPWGLCVRHLRGPGKDEEKPQPASPDQCAEVMAHLCRLYLDQQTLRSIQAGVQALVALASNSKELP